LIMQPNASSVSVPLSPVISVNMRALLRYF
jgi:hypothetical protein